MYLLLSSCAIIDMPEVQSKVKCQQQSGACWSCVSGCKLVMTWQDRMQGQSCTACMALSSLLFASVPANQSLKSIGSFRSDHTVRGARSDARVGHRCMLSWQCSAGSLVYTPCRCCQDTPAGLLSCFGMGPALHRQGPSLTHIWL